MDFDRIPSFFPFVVIVFWLVISLVISRIGGWAALADVYRLEDSFEGERMRFRSGQMRYAMSYNNCLTIGADRRGLYLSVFFFFRLGHPPLFIPWSEITVTEKQRYFMNATEFTFSRVPGVYLRLSSNTAKMVLAWNSAREGSAPVAHKAADPAG
jgi:hypothetical protein